MNKDWSEKNKTIQQMIGKETTYKAGIKLLIEFRSELFEQITQIVNGFPREAFTQMPFAGANGYHSKTLAYSIWHIFRIEDIVAHIYETQGLDVGYDISYDFFWSFNEFEKDYSVSDENGLTKENHQWIRDYMKDKL